MNDNSNENKGLEELNNTQKVEELTNNEEIKSEVEEVKEEALSEVTANNSKGKLVIFVIVLMILCGLLGYFIFQKLTDKNNSNQTNNNQINNNITATDSDNKIDNVSMKFYLEEIEFVYNRKINLENYITLENIDINNVTFTIDNEELGTIENHSFNTKNKKGEATITAQYKNLTSTMKVKVDTRKIYFYDDNGSIKDLSYEDKNEKYNRFYADYTYLGKYECISDKCEKFLNSSIVNNNSNILIQDNSKIYLYNYKTEKIIETYDFAYNFVQNGSSTNFIFIIKNDKVAVVDSNGNVLTPYYDDIGNYKRTMSNAKGIANYLETALKDIILKDTTTYKVGDKYGLLSLINGKEITEAKYDELNLYDNCFTSKFLIDYKINDKYGIINYKTGTEITEAKYNKISIYQDNIVATLNDLEYVIDNNGNLNEKGYKKILFSTDDVIVIKDNDYIDIVDYSGNSKLTEKIEAKDFEFDRTCRICFELCGPSDYIYLKDDGTILITMVDEQYKEIHYNYNPTTNILTKQ